VTSQKFEFGDVVYQPDILGCSERLRYFVLGGAPVYKADGFDADGFDYDVLVLIGCGDRGCPSYHQEGAVDTLIEEFFAIDKTFSNGRDE
jgi:hypothetical protein